MFKTFSNAWKVEDIRKKIVFTLFIILLYRIGAAIPVPYINKELLGQYFQSASNTMFGLLNVMSGSALSQATVFALSIQPYINASIIIQLLTVAIPAFERWQKEGPEGRKKISRITKYTAVALALFQAVMLYINMHNQSAAYFTTAFGTGFFAEAIVFLLIVFSFVAGTSVLTWLGDKISEVGIGNGISMLIFAGIVARAPQWIGNVISIAAKGTDVNGIEVAKKLYLRIPLVIAVVAIFAAVLIAIVWMELAERRLGVVYSQRVVGRKIMGGQKSYIPLKVNSAGVLPIIFAMSLLQFPLTIASFINNSGKVTQGLQSFNNTWWYIILYAVLIVGFTFFYNMVYFDPKEYANNIINNGGQLTEIKTNSRKTTAQYIKKIQNRITWFGSIFLAVLAILPSILGKVCGYIKGIEVGSLELWLGGTSMLILVGVALEIVRTLEAQLMMRHYKGGKGGFLG